MTVTGPGSSWTNTNTTLVASSGIGTLNVLNGATASAGLLLSIADLSSGQGTVNVSGAGSTLTSDGALSVGRIGTGTLTIADGGVVNANADTFVASFSGSTGTLNIGNGGAAGTLNSASVNFGNGT
ncbi:autotransporter outer membrane beta-barrel domain-containing protein, partial [Phyllobacterium phragmitis]